MYNLALTMSSRVYVGHLPSRATERDIEHFFRGFGRIRDIVLKNGFGFVVIYLLYTFLQKKYYRNLMTLVTRKMLCMT